MRKIISILFLLIANQLLAQPSQDIRGKVVDKDSKKGLLGATVNVAEYGNSKIAITDSVGNFLLRSIPVGRIHLTATYSGYQPFTSNDIVLNVAKQPDITIELQEAGFIKEEITIKAIRNPKQPVNKYVVTSGRSFTAEETQRYAASVNDPGRMAVAFPGVQATKDTRSDIIIRGNNPVGMQWKLEGIDIINPNHFARKGSSGGGITILSLSMLDNSDFLTGGMPAEYGDVLSGVFDMHFRKGNDQKSEHTFKAGMIGLDYSTEGPIKKGASSYLLNYRYSTLGLLQAIGLNLVGERESNTFQDLSFNISLGNNSKSAWNIWGMGGLSKEEYDPVMPVTDWKQYDDYAIYDFRTKMGATGIGNTIKLSDKAFLKSSLAFIHQKVTFKDDTLNKQLVPSMVNNESYLQQRLSFSSFINTKLSVASSFKTGIYLTDLSYDLQREHFNFGSNGYEKLNSGNGNTILIQPYAQMSLKAGQKWTFNPGIHYMYLALNKKSVVDPRLSIQYKLSPRQSLTASYGLFSKMVSLGSYFLNLNGNYVNKDLDFIRSAHYILAYDHALNGGWRFHTEGYFQQLSKVPVVNDANRTYWILNDLDGYAKEALVSKGKGENKGVDITIEKTFTKGFFMLSNFSIYSSTFQSLNNKRYNTRFNSSTAGSWLGGKEWNMQNNKVFQIGGKLIYNGGFRISPLAAANGYSREPVLNEMNPYSEKISPYFRTDARIAIRKDKAKVAWQISMDIQNIFGLKNADALARRYDPTTNQWVGDVQSGIVPVLSYQLDF